MTATLDIGSRWELFVDRWLIEHGYPAHINCLPPIGLRDAVRALRGQPNDPTPPADQLPGLDDQERA